MREPRFDIPAIGLSDGVLADVLRLEVETDPDGLKNLIVNPDGSLGGYGWVAPVNGTLVRGAVVAGTQLLEFVTAPSTSVATYYTSELVPVTAGQYIAGRWNEQGFSSGTTGYYRARFEFVNAAGTLVSSSPQSGYYQNLTVGTIRAYGATLVPTGATRARLRFDAYSNTSAANPTAGRAYRYKDVAVATAATAAELGSTIRKNLIPNPSFEVNTTGWLAEPGDSIARTTAQSVIGTASLAVTGGAARTATGTAGIPVVPGTFYTLRASVRAATTARSGGFRFEYYNSSGTKIQTADNGSFTDSASGWTPATTFTLAPTGAAFLSVVIMWDSAGISEVHYLDTVILESGNNESATYFDGDTPDASGWVYDWTGVPNASASTATTSTLDYFPPVPVVDVLGPTHKIGVSREALAVGTLTAEILDATLDPASAPLIRPGRAVRLSARKTSGDWSILYTGVLTHAKVEYHLLEDVPDRKRARISLIAVDNIAQLAAAQRTESVATIAELPYVLEGAGVPWSVNGSGNQVATATVRATADNVTALDQIALTRDTVHGYAWVDQLGILQAWDAASLSTTPVLVHDESVYSDASIGFDTDALINEVVVTVRSTDASGETVETVTTYTDAASISQWGRKRGEFTVLAPTNPATFAAAVLAANATPTVRINNTTTNVRNADLLDVAHLDLYDAVTLVNTDKAINQLARVSTIKMDIDNGAFMIDHEFGDPDAVASPQVIPPAQNGSAPRIQAGTAAFPNPTTIAAGTGAFVDVTFPTPFTTTPVVVVSLSSANGGTQRYVPRAINKSATGFRLYLYNVGSVDTTTAATTSVDWHAYGA